MALMEVMVEMAVYAQVQVPLGIVQIVATLVAVDPTTAVMAHFVVRAATILGPVPVVVVTEQAEVPEVVLNFRHLVMQPS
jgi:hypothetical protein